MSDDDLAKLNASVGEEFTNRLFRLKERESQESPPGEKRRKREDWVGSPSGFSSKPVQEKPISPVKPRIVLKMSGLRRQAPDDDDDENEGL